MNGRKQRKMKDFSRRKYKAEKEELEEKDIGERKEKRYTKRERKKERKG